MFDIYIPVYKVLAPETGTIDFIKRKYKIIRIAAIPAITDKEIFTNFLILLLHRLAFLFPLVRYCFS